MEKLRLCRRHGSANRPNRVLNVGDPSTWWKPALDVERGRFAGPSAHADVSVVVVTHNSARDISELIDGLRVAAHDRSFRLIVVDNHSSDDTVGIVQADEDIILVESGGNLGYSGGINVGLAFTGNCDNVLFLNPDLAIAPDAVTRLLGAADKERVGAVVPLILDEDGAIYPSLYREPSLIRCLCDALLGRNICSLLGLPSESDIRRESYCEPHDVDWAMGAALLVPAAVAREVGEWNEAFFLYSEEVDYFRRIRTRNLRIRFEPSAVVKHREGGSGKSADLAALKAVNRVRYIAMYHGSVYSAMFHAAVALRHTLRSYNAVHRHTLAVVLSRRRWQQLSHHTSSVRPVSGA
jgi:GT2 family glycosyltransferase